MHINKGNALTELCLVAITTEKLVIDINYDSDDKTNKG